MYLAEIFLHDWQQRFTVAAANPTNAHRPLTELHDLAASLSHVETRRVSSDYTLQFQGKRYQIARASVSVGLKSQQVRVEARLDGSIAVRFEGRYLEVTVCGPKAADASAQRDARPVRKDHNRDGRSNWMRDYPLNLSRSPASPVGDSSRNC